MITGWDQPYPLAAAHVESQSQSPDTEKSDSSKPSDNAFLLSPPSEQDLIPDSCLKEKSTDTMLWANMPVMSSYQPSWGFPPASSYSSRGRAIGSSEGQPSGVDDSERGSFFNVHHHHHHHHHSHPSYHRCDDDAGSSMEDDGFGEDTEHIDFSALKGYLNVFRPAADADPADLKKGKYVFYSLQTGLLRHHILADVCKSGHSHGGDYGHNTYRPGSPPLSPIPNHLRNLSKVMRSGPFWLDICNPTKEELYALSEIFKMHPLTLEGLESDGEEIREKCDVFEKYYFVCIKTFESDSRSVDYMLPINLFMLVSPSCVVTIHRDPLEFSHTIAKRMRLLTARTGLASDWIVYTILEDVLEMFVPLVRSAETEIDSIDDLVTKQAKASINSPTHSELLGRIACARKRVTQLIRLMSAKSELLRVIAKRCSMRFSEDAHLYLRDLQDHTAMVDQTLHHYDDSLNRSHANYLALLSIDISETSNHMSDVMKKLTAASTVALPWSMITGLMGMNIFVPGGDSYHTESWIPWLCLFFAMSISSVIIYFVGRRRDWF